MGLCLGGGGITGAMYEVGCLAALEEFFDGFAASDFDVFVATSSGATLATVLAGGFPAMRLYRALLDPADDFFPLKRNHLIRLDTSEWRRVAKSVVGAVRRLVSYAASRPLEIDLWNELDRFWDSVPSGIFALVGYEKFLDAFMARRGIPQRFDELPRKLLLVANDLDLGERVVFGAGELTDVPIARAICATGAIPLLFAPVRIGERDFIDGGLGNIAHADLAAEEGCELVLIVNPMVPVRADLDEREIPTGHGKKRRVRDKGLIWVQSQAFRLRAQARLLEGLADFEREHPNVAHYLLEPEPDDATIFMYSPMNFAARRAILEDGFTQTMRLLKSPDSSLRAMFEKAGLRAKGA